MSTPDGATSAADLLPVSGTRRPGALVPPDSAASRALVAVVAVLAFLAALAAIGGIVVAEATRAWRGDLLTEATIQVRPAPGRDLGGDLAKAAALARATPGILSAEPLTKSDTDRLLEPWLGSGLDLADLPIPGLVVLRLADPRPDLGELGARLAAAVPGAMLDDHGAWRARLTRLGGSVVFLAFGLAALVLAASGAAVIFATRGAVADNREVVEVLRLVGAEDVTIARVFGARFARLGLEGGAIGAVAACLFAAAVVVFAATLVGGPGGSAAAALLGGLDFDPAALLLAVPVPPLTALIAGIASRATVRRYLSIS